MIGGLLDVLLVSGSELPEFEGLRRAGLAVERSDSLVSALLRLRAGRAALAIAAGDVCSGRERDAFAALREAGAGAILAVYPPPLAWRASRALRAGADDCVVLPADVGAVEARALRLIRPATPGIRSLDGSAADPATGGSAALEPLLRDIAVMNRQVGDLDRLLDETVRMFAKRSGARRCSVMLLNEARTELRVVASTGFADPSPRAPVPLGHGFAGHVAKTGIPLVVADVERLRADATNGLGAAAPGTYDTRSCVLVPLRTANGVLGVACMADKSGARAFDESDLLTLRLLADEAAQAIENAQQFRQMRDLAAIDGLTGLANRRQFDIALERELQRARRYERHLTLALFDVDNFKKYNDSCGHQAGDRALATIGALLRSSLREVDVVARYGGEEFAVILPETAARPGGGVSPFPFLERLRRRVEETAFPGEEKLPGGRLTISGGIACFPDDANSLESLIREADRALYASKAHGRNVITDRGAVVPA